MEQTAERMDADTREVIDKGFGRREFIAGLAATLGLAAIGVPGCSSPTLKETPPTEVISPDEIFQGCCHTICGGSSRFNVHVRDGKIVKTSVINDPKDPQHLCARGLSHPQMTYAPERIQYPMRRVEGTERGAGEWERITWDEAIDEIATKWKGYIEEFGQASVGFVYGSGTIFNNQYIWTRLKHAFGGTEVMVYDCMATLNAGKDIFGRSVNLVGNDGLDILRSKNLFVFGSNITESKYGSVPTLWEAIDGGLRVIVIDPNYSDIASKADMHIPIRQATDSALALAMTKLIIDGGKADEDYLRKNTVAPFLVKEDGYTYVKAADIGIELEYTEGPSTGFIPGTNDPVKGDPIPPSDEYGRPIDYVVAAVDGTFNTPDQIADPVLTGSFTVNGIPCKTAYQLLIERVGEWTPERAAVVCDLPVETIIELADIFADGPSGIALNFGPDRYCNGGVATHCIFTLSIVAGQVGHSGGGIESGSGSAFKPGLAPTTDFTATWFPPNAVLNSIMIPTPYLPEAMETGMFNGSPLPLKSMVSYCNNRYATSPERNAQLKAEAKIEFLISVDTFLTETARMSDLVLPIPYNFEYEAIGGGHKFNDKAIEPLFETKTDVEIACAIGRAMGFEGFDLDDASFYQMYYENETNQENDWNWDRIKRDKIIYNDNEPQPYIYGNIDYGTTFMSPTRRANFFLEDPLNYFDQTKPIDKKLSALPHFKLPNEAWPQTIDTFEANPLGEKYPLGLISYHYRLKAHTFFSMVPQLLEIRPEPTVFISPNDAAARGIAENDYARVFNDRGSMIARAHIDAACRPGTLKTEHGWWSEQHIAGDRVNALDSIAVDDHWPALEHFDLLVEAEKYDVEEEN
jgi:molybdopterin-containing oxidoreductase family molybdopterin binding subunit